MFQMCIFLVQWTGTMQQSCSNLIGFCLHPDTMLVFGLKPDCCPTVSSDKQQKRRPQLASPFLPSEDQQQFALVVCCQCHLHQILSSCITSVVVGRNTGLSFVGHQQAEQVFVLVHDGGLSTWEVLPVGILSPDFLSLPWIWLVGTR